MKLEVEIVAAHSLVDFSTGETKFWAVVMLGDTAAEVSLTTEQYETMLGSYASDAEAPAVPSPSPFVSRDPGDGDTLGAEVKRVLRQGGGYPAPASRPFRRGAAEADASDGFNPEYDE